ncbi:hypothetical protein VF14_14890 [Nostoc linckia z18]|uniref:Uncharacterized protein n=3 Tax=Nostoc linckia TaxID=92942 RepID=A0A9Q6EKJ0_NOSLI|nr:hypothetical protein VF02_22255 [Nostoc linckia z1]PHJ63976.1 hypothetical protein VF05_23225 [Nostoc linckia z3]PHJ76377.1 hypothetical protein VF03_07790 [Nostoc linckia z2]PHJ83173.1 hypothetical protein VF06_13735 [Nostoc linckia z4]PHJ90194.1 hypothetical protein VF07_09690 [Nostoc linckia z6]PHJ99655.1 hypothetical protein VF04_05615 [Nostoc linckia z7]PHK02146.1 hypothetical protein VF08_19920 [Nostoc linckia z8]PHK11468.1 hypothetical protein VF09_07345 [Nostoc linckia z9]PHK2079
MMSRFVSIFLAGLIASASALAISPKADASYIVELDNHSYHQNDDANYELQSRNYRRGDDYRDRDFRNIRDDGRRYDRDNRRYDRDNRRYDRDNRRYDRDNRRYDRDNRRYDRDNRRYDRDNRRYDRDGDFRNIRNDRRRYERDRYWNRY